MIVGIDFGTTNSSVAYLAPRGPELIVNERGERLTPSVVCFRSEREALVALKALPQDIGVSEGIKLALKALTR